MSDLIDTTEMYLRTVYELLEEGIVPMRARIAERIGHSGPTVSQTIARMDRDGLIRVNADRQLQLTPEGHALAMRVMRKHRLAERLLTDVIRLDWPLVHDEACRWEHVMSEQVEEKLWHLLGEPRHSPYGNPIPGVAEIGGDVRPESFLAGVAPLTDMLGSDDDGADEGTPAGARTTGPVRVEIARLGETIQTDTDLLRRFEQAGIVPGGRVDAVRSESVVTIGVAPSRIDITPEEACHIFVRSGRQGA